MKVYTALFEAESATPVLYYKGEGLLRNGFPFFLPDKEPLYHAVPVLALRIAKTGKEIAPRFALRYVEALGVGFDILCPRLLMRLSASGLPWDTAVAFADSAAAFFPTPYVQPQIVTEGRFPHYAEAQLALSVTLPDGSSFTETYAPEMPEKALSALSALTLLHCGDVLLLRKEITRAVPLAIGEQSLISLAEHADTPYPLRVK